jgi:hypothetical protein
MAARISNKLKRSVIGNATGLARDVITLVEELALDKAGIPHDNADTADQHEPERVVPTPSPLGTLTDIESSTTEKPTKPGAAQTKSGSLYAQ